MLSLENKKNKRTAELGTQQNVIAIGTEIIGDIVSQGPFRIDGTIEGNIKTSGKIVVGKTGFIKGTLNGIDASFEGKFSGKLVLSGTLTIKSTAHIEGEVQINKLSVEPGATFNASCNMKGDVKALTNESAQQQQAKQTKQA